MLDISKINNHVPAELRSLIGDLRRVHTSPVTIHVEMRDGSYQMLDFYDERLPSTREETRRIATIRYEGGNFILRSVRIKNKKFSPGSGGYMERLTNDPRKMLKWMREYVTPLTHREIMDVTDDVGRAYENWATHPERAMHDAMPGAVSRNFSMLLMEEMANMRAIGFTQFATPQFRKIYEEVLPLYDEHVRRSSLIVKHVHLFIEASGKVVVTATTGAPYGWDSVVYENMDKVPDNIQQQVAMLKLVEKGKYLPEVGQRMADDIYWVHVFASS